MLIAMLLMSPEIFPANICLLFSLLSNTEYTALIKLLIVNNESYCASGYMIAAVLIVQLQFISVLSDYISSTNQHTG